MRISKCQGLLIGLILINLCLMWYFTHTHNDIQTSGETSKHDITIIIPAFESFENDVSSSLNQILSLYPHIQILVLCEKIPYPYINLPENAQFVIQESNPTVPKYMTDPFWYIQTKYVLVFPDGIRIRKHSLDDLVWQMKENHDKSIVIASVESTITSCLLIDFDLKRWTLTYSKTKELKKCNAFRNDVAVLFTKKIVREFTDVFAKPFYESFFIQAKLRNIKLLVSNESYFSLGKILFPDSHNKWKHDEKKKKHQLDLYKTFGIKRVISSNGIEKWFGCSKTTPRCFPTVLDVPYYLYDNRWTPPCCLKILRETTKHVVRSLAVAGVTYWLEGGSLLGAARHQDIIPWDYDVDLGVFLNNITRSKFLSAVWRGSKKVDDKGYVWEKAQEGDFLRVQYSKVNHLHVDIFPFYERNGIMTKNTWFKTHRQDREFPARYLKPLQRIPFVGIMAAVPNHYKDFLELKFGSGVIEKPQYPFAGKLMQRNRIIIKAND